MINTCTKENIALINMLKWIAQYLYYSKFKIPCRNIKNIKIGIHISILKSFIQGESSPWKFPLSFGYHLHTNLLVQTLSKFLTQNQIHRCRPWCITLTTPLKVSTKLMMWSLSHCFYLVSVGEGLTTLVTAINALFWKYY